MSLPRCLLRAALLSACLTACFINAALAQNFTASLTGQVTDAAGASVPGALIAVTNTGTNRTFTAQTDTAGRYLVLNLPPGNYALRAEAPGFKRLERGGITLQVDQAARIDLALETGAVNETVQVTAEAPLINTETGAKGQVIDNHEIANLPLNGRDFSELAFLTPGVVDSSEGVANAGFAAINGGRADGVNFQIDGLNNRSNRNGDPVVRPSVDAVQEFKVQTSAYAADYGAVGSGMINIALKGGTNQYHGTVYEFVRNDIFDARNFFDVNKRKLRRNQFGGTLGGPVDLPSWLFGPLAYRGQDRTFFFFSYEALRERRGDTRVLRVPTLEQRRGDFSALLTATNRIFLRDPAKTGVCNATNQTACFPGNIIPASRFHPSSARLLDFIPLPNRAGVNNLATAAVGETDRNDFIVKFDQRIRQNDSLAINFIRGGSRGASPFSGGLPGFGSFSDNGNKQAGARLTNVFNATTSNEFRFAFTRAINFSNRGTGDAALQALVSSLSGVADTALAGVPVISITGYTNIGHAIAEPLDIAVDGLQFYDALSLVRGRHSLRVGADIIRTKFAQLFANNARGTINFLGRVTGQSNATPVPFADFLLGLPESSNRLVSPRVNTLLSTTYGFFVQDDFKLARRLSLNLGLRYDLFTPPVEQDGILANFVPELNRIIRAGEAGFPEALMTTDKTNFAPRFGLAWQPFEKDNFVVRGGYGIFYSNAAQNTGRQLLANNFPFSNSQNFIRSTTNLLGFTFSDPFPATTAGTIATTIPSGIAFDSPTSYMQQYNLTLERKLMKATVLEVGYVGSRGVHLGRRYDINQQIRRSPTDIVRPFPQYNGAIRYVAFGSDSYYNSLQVTLRRAFRSGFGYRANFVWSKSIDDASSVNGAGSQGTGFAGEAQDSRNLKLERGLSGFNRPRTLTVDFSYLVPFGKGKRRFTDGWGDALLGGWQFNGIVRLLDGQPFTPGDSTFNFALGEASRPDRIGSGRLDNPTVERWFNVQDFVPVPSGSFRFGTSGRNILYGPARKQIDLSLMKNFVFSEQRKLQFRCEVFNAPNIANFFLPEKNVDLPTAGTITRASAGREMQFALKYIF
jgi:hypothetical protein